MLSLSEIKREVGPVLVKAGDLLLSFFKNGVSYKNKANQSIVTEADIQVEKFLIENLSKILPEASFFAEESGAQGDLSTLCWVIDPLDGTTNFVHGIPYFCISIALTKNNEPVLGFVYQPILGQMFHAIKGEGAFLNNSPIKVSSINKFDQTFLVVGIPYEKSDSYLRGFFDDMSEIMRKTLTFRHFGAVALDLAYVACGKVDAIFFEDMFWWDFAAGILLIKEAGGVITDFSHKPIGMDSKSLIGANATIHKGFMDILGKKEQ